MLCLGIADHGILLPAGYRATVYFKLLRVPLAAAAGASATVCQQPLSGGTAVLASLHEAETEPAG
jgi:hypothetical protein